MDLLVVRPFGAYAVGDRITDDATIARLLASESAGNLVRVRPLPPAPQPDAKQGE